MWLKQREACWQGLLHFEFFQGKRPGCCSVKTLLVTHNENFLQMSSSGKGNSLQWHSHNSRTAEKRTTRPVRNTGHCTPPPWLLPKWCLCPHAPVSLKQLPWLSCSHTEWPPELCSSCVSSLNNLRTTAKSKFSENELRRPSFVHVTFHGPMRQHPRAYPWDKISVRNVFGLHRTNT